MSIVYLDGKWLNAEKASIGIDNRSFRYGDGFFETIRCVQNQLPLWSYHAQRLFATLDTLQFEKPAYLSPDFISDLILQLVGRNGHGKLARVRVTVFRGDGGIYDSINLRPQLLIQSWALNPENNKLNENGLVIGDYKAGFKAGDAFSNIKSNNYLLYVMAAMYAKQQHWNDALVYNHKGGLADATIANLWLVKDGEIFTPPLSDGPVAGVMRRYLLDHLRNAGFKAAERSVMPSDLDMADEIFLTNAIYGLKWVRQYLDRNLHSDMAARIHASLIAPLWKGATI